MKQLQHRALSLAGTASTIAIVLTGGVLAATAAPVGNPCPTSSIEVDATSVEQIVLHPSSVLSDPEAFWRDDAAYALAARWHATNAVEIPWDTWRQRVRRFAELTAAERATDPAVRLTSELTARAEAWLAATRPLVCKFLPATGAPLDTTVHLSAALTPYSFMTNGQIVVDVTSPVFDGNCDTILDLLTHEVFHIGYGWRRSARREVELEDPELYRMLDALHNEGIATYVGERARELYPLAVHADYALLADPAEVRRLTDALNRLFAAAPAMAPEERRSASWELGVVQRAYYVVGATMARTIDENLGRSALVDTIVAGPRTFVATFNRVAPPELRLVELSPPAVAPPSHALRVAALDDDPAQLAAAIDRLRIDRPVDAPGLESAVNAIGYRLLRADRIEDATEVLRLAVDLFPNSANAHDSLGEALMVGGDRAAAIASYRRSLALDPANTNAVTMLARLDARPLGDDRSIDGIGARVVAHAARLAAQGPRPAASAGELAAARDLARSWSELGLEVAWEPFTFDDFEIERLTLTLAGLAAEPVVIGIDPFTGPLSFDAEAVIVAAADDEPPADVAGRLVITDHPMMQFMIAAANPAAVVCVGEEDFARFAGQGDRLVRLEVVGSRHSRQSHNLVATVGADRGPRLLVTAHLDAYRDSPGANDNGTGLGALIELAGMLTARGEVSEMAVTLVAFGAEELGSAGSRAYVEHHRDQLADIVAVVNLDTLGGGAGPEIGSAADVDLPAGNQRGDGTPRVLQNVAWEGLDGRWRLLHPQLLELATRSNSPQWLEEEIAAAAAATGIELGRRNLMSDHRSFARAGIPATSIQSGKHTIHSPDDTADRLVVATVDRACRVAAELIGRLRALPREGR